MALPLPLPVAEPGTLSLPIAPTFHKRPHEDSACIDARDPKTTKIVMDGPRFLTHVVTPAFQRCHPDTSFGHMLRLSEAASSLAQRIYPAVWEVADHLVPEDPSITQVNIEGWALTHPVMGVRYSMDLEKKLSPQTYAALLSHKGQIHPPASNLVNLFRWESLYRRSASDLRDTSPHTSLPFGDSVQWLLRGLLTPLNAEYLSDDDLCKWLADYGILPERDSSSSSWRTAALATFFHEQNKLLIEIAESGWVGVFEDEGHVRNDVNVIVDFISLAVGRPTMIELIRILSHARMYKSSDSLVKLQPWFANQLMVLPSSLPTSMGSRVPDTLFGAIWSLIESAIDETHPTCAETELFSLIRKRLEELTVAESSAVELAREIIHEIHIYRLPRPPTDVEQKCSSSSPPPLQLAHTRSRNLLPIPLPRMEMGEMDLLLESELESFSAPGTIVFGYTDGALNIDRLGFTNTTVGEGSETKITFELDEREVTSSSSSESSVEEEEEVVDEEEGSDDEEEDDEGDV